VDIGELRTGNPVIYMGTEYSVANINAVYSTVVLTDGTGYMCEHDLEDVRPVELEIRHVLELGFERNPDTRRRYDLRRGLHTYCFDWSEKSGIHGLGIVTSDLDDKETGYVVFAWRITTAHRFQNIMKSLDYSQQ